MIKNLSKSFAGTASASDISVTSPVQIVFVPGDAPIQRPRTRCTTNIEIVDDTEQETNETFFVFIASPTDCLGQPSVTTVTIQDNDGVYVCVDFVLWGRGVEG